MLVCTQNECPVQLCVVVTAVRRVIKLAGLVTLVYSRLVAGVRTNVQRAGRADARDPQL